MGDVVLDDRIPCAGEDRSGYSKGAGATRELAVDQTNNGLPDRLPRSVRALVAPVLVPDAIDVMADVEKPAALDILAELAADIGELALEFVSARQRFLHSIAGRSITAPMMGLAPDGALERERPARGRPSAVMNRRERERVEAQPTSVVGQRGSVF